MNNFVLLNIEWNCYNGFIFQFLHFSTYNPFNTDSSMFGLNISKSFAVLEIFYFGIRLF